MKTLFISTIQPSRKLAGWHYIEGISELFSSFSEVHFWFSLLNGGERFEKDVGFRFAKVVSYKSPFVLKTKSVFSNTHFAHAFHKDHIPSLEDTLRHLQPENVVFTNLSAGCYLDVVKKAKPDAKTVLLQHNVEYLVISEFSKYASTRIQRIYYLLQKQSVKRLENKILNTVDYVISISPSDKENFRRIYNIDERKISVIRPFFSYSAGLYKLDNKEDDNFKNLLFVAAFDWYPNIRGAEFFAKNVLDKVLKHSPDVRLYLVGRNPSAAVLGLKKLYPDNIVITGTVPDVDEYYKISNCVIIPVFLGPGIKLKVLEAMASGVPTVMTSYVAKDYDLLGKGFLIADTPEEFESAIKKVLEDQDFANEISRKQVEWYENYLAQERAHALEVIKKILEE